MTNDDTCNATKNNGDPCTYTAKHDDGKCGVHTTTTDTDNGGRPSILDDVWDDVMQAAEEGLTLEGIARVAGIGVRTLHEWRDQHKEFSQSLKRARARGERELIQDADAEFILERSYGYQKTQEIEHSGGGLLGEGLSKDEKDLIREGFGNNPRDPDE